MRTSPTPWAPKFLASWQSAAVSAFARTSSSRTKSALVKNLSIALISGVNFWGNTGLCKYWLTDDSTTSLAPRYTAPVAPSMDIKSPACTTVSITWKYPSSILTFTSSAPQTATRPMPRATTAACEVLPPREVKIPWAATMPGRSSGEVSLRTKITGTPANAWSTAVLESKTTRPTAAPGEAGIPVVNFSVVARESN